MTELEALAKRLNNRPFTGRDHEEWMRVKSETSKSRERSTCGFVHPIS